MTNQNNVPTAPGFYYYRGGDIVCVYGEPGDLWVMTFGTASTYAVEEMNPLEWGKLVPMRDDTPAESLSDTVSRMARILGMQAENDQRKACGHSMAYVEDDFLNEALR